MINKVCLSFALGVLLIGSAPAPAQSGPLPEEFIGELTGRARAALPMARLEDGSSIPPETEAERSQPLVPRPLEIQTILRGILTAQMEACGLDWQHLSYQPYMRALRGRYSGKPMAYLGLLHGLTQGMTREALGEAAGCSDTFRARLTAEAANRAIEVP